MVSKHKRILISWIGGNDLNSEPTALDSAGPIRSTLRTNSFDRVELLYNYPQEVVVPYIQQLENEFDLPLVAHHQKLTSPVDFSEIYASANHHLSLLDDAESELCILLSPGTPAMQAVWILLGKTSYQVTFYQSTIEQGVQEVDIPFDISAEFKPKPLLNDSVLFNTDAPIDAAFDDIITQSPTMLELKQRATVLAKHNVPVLIQGETGTGKELFAIAIHNASERKAKPFIPINCGAIPSELIDSILFGHKKGAFTGAHIDTLGAFQKANGGTIFLDEFGELPKDAQVRLLRVLQSGEIAPVGSSSSIHVDIRVIAATNRDLLEEVSSGRFREDLFYRVAVGILNLPALREREGDISLLIDKLLEDINERVATDGNKKEISVKGKNILVSHRWQGNIRELYATLLRAFIWSATNKITDTDIQSVIIKMPNQSEAILDREFVENFDIQDVMTEVARHYLTRALDESNQNLTQAAQKLGLASYQTLKGWIEKYQVK